MTLSENINRAISDFTTIKQAIINQGVAVPDGTATSKYGELIEKISGNSGDNINSKVGSKRNCSSIESSYMIQANGIAVGNGQYDIVHYNVMPYSAIYVKAKDDVNNACKFIWYTNNVVSTQNTDRLVGTPVTDVTDGIVIVPEGANYISFSQLKTDTETGVYKLEEDKPAIKPDIYLDYAGEIFRYSGRTVTRSTELPAYCAYFWMDDWFVPCVISNYEEGVAYRMYVEDSSSQGSIEYMGKTWYYNMHSGGSYKQVHDSSNYKRHFLGNYTAEEENELKPVYDLLDLLGQIGEV